MAFDSRIDTHSFTWAAVKHLADEEIDQASQILEAVGVDERTADTARGQIKAMRAILALAEQDSEHVSE